MKKIYKNVMVLFIVASLSFGCEDVSDMALDRIVAPALITFQDLGDGNDFSYPLDENVALTVGFRMMSKNGVYIDTLDYGSANISAINIYSTVNSQTKMLNENFPINNGKAEISKPWNEILGGIAAKDASNIRLEFSGMVDGVAFTKYQTISIDK
jgi:hypothetical protein